MKSTEFPLKMRSLEVTLSTFRTSAMMVKAPNAWCGLVRVMTQVMASVLMMHATAGR